MDALLEGGTMLWTCHLGFIGGGKCSTYHWRFMGECYVFKRVLKVYWRRDIVWTSHLEFMGGGSFQLIIQGFWGNVILSSRFVKFIGEGILSELAI